MITLSIDFNQVDQKRIKPFTKKDGTQANYLELILIETPNGKYGDFMVKQGVTKEERQARLDMPILGNARIVGGVRPAAVAGTSEPVKKDGVPF